MRLFAMLRFLLPKPKCATLAVIQKIAAHSDEAPQFFIRAKAPNGDVLFHSECYSQKSNAIRAAHGIASTKFEVLE